MKRLGNIWKRVISFDNLLLAYKKARKGKAGRRDVAVFSLQLEKQLFQLQRELATDTYEPGEYRLFTIYERKPRVIAAAPFRDRVVHHALMNIIDPALDRTFIDDSYACRKGKGVHAAVKRYQVWAQRYYYVLKMDIRKYFPSIDHEILKQKLHNRIKDKSLLKLFGIIIDKSPQSCRATYDVYRPDFILPEQRRYGIPIGNLTSQFFANLYLDDLDHFIKESLACKAYLRYVDDSVILDDDKGRLTELREIVRDKLLCERLRLHPRKAHISRVQDGLNLLGYFVLPDRKYLRNDNGHRFSRKLRKFSKHYASGRIDWQTINDSVQSWIGHASHADTYGLRKKIFSRIVFRRGTDQ